MRSSLIWILPLCLVFPPLGAAKPKPKTKPAPAVAALQAQVKKLTEERDELQERLAATAGLQEEAATAKKGRELARRELEACQKELAQLRASFGENQQSGDALLREIQKARSEGQALQAEVDRLRHDLGEAQARLRGKVDPGTPVPLGPDVVPAKPLNLNRVTPKVRRVDRGVVVVNVLVGENGEVLEARLLQPLPGEGEWVQKANEACVEAASRLVFDPARIGDGKTPVRVWQGVGFYLE